MNQVYNQFLDFDREFVELRSPYVVDDVRCHYYYGFFEHSELNGQGIGWPQPRMVMRVTRGGIVHPFISSRLRSHLGVIEAPLTEPQFAHIQGIVLNEFFLYKLSKDLTDG